MLCSENNNKRKDKQSHETQKIDVVHKKARLHQRQINFTVSCIIKCRIPSLYITIQETLIHPENTKLPQKLYPKNLTTLFYSIHINTGTLFLLYLAGEAFIETSCSWSLLGTMEQKIHFSIYNKVHETLLINPVQQCLNYCAIPIWKHVYPTSHPTGITYAEFDTLNH